MHKSIHTLEAPNAVGPYSQAIVAEGKTMVFVSGQIPLNPATMKIEAESIEEQARCSLRNLKTILEASGANLASVVKTTVYLKSMGDFAAFNQEYEKFFSEHKPARACVEVARLPRDALVEIDAIAVI